MSWQQSGGARANTSLLRAAWQPLGMVLASQVIVGRPPCFKKGLRCSQTGATVQGPQCSLYSLVLLCRYPNSSPGLAVSPGCQDVEELLLLRAVPQSMRLRHVLGMRRGANESCATLFIKPRGLADHLQLPCIYQDLCVAWLSSSHPLPLFPRPALLHQ